MKKIMILIFFTFFALDVSAQFRPSESQYFDVNNIFKNIGFEQGFSGWDITTTCTKSVEAEVPYLNKSLKLVCVAQDFEVSQATSALTGLDIQGLSSVKMKASADGVEYKIYNDSTESLSMDIPVNSKIDRYEIPFLIDDIENSSSIVATSYTGTVIIDDFKLGIAPEGYTQSLSVVSKWKPYTPTTQGFGTIADNTLEWRQVGSNVEIRGGFVCGVSVGTEAQVGLPNAYTSSQTSASLELGGKWRRGLVSANKGGEILINDGNNFLNFSSIATISTTTAGNSLAKVYGNDVCGNSERISINASIPVNELSATPKAFTVSKTGFPVMTGAGVTAPLGVTALTTKIKFTETEDKRNYWNGDSFTVTDSSDAGYYTIKGSIFLTTGSAAMQVRLYKNDAYEKVIGSSDATTVLLPFNGSIKMEVGDTISLRLNIGDTLQNNSQVHHIHIQKIPDEAYIAGLFSGLETKCQTKTLGTAKGTSGVIADLTFTGLDTSKKYSYVAKLGSVQSDGANNDKYILLEVNDTEILGDSQRSTSGETRFGQDISSPMFSPDSTTLEVEIVAILGMTITEAGATLCELPSAYYKETSEW